MKTNTARHHIHLNRLLPALLTFAGATAGTVADVTYEFTPVTLTGINDSSLWPVGLNNKGQVLIYSENPDGEPALWLHGGRGQSLVVASTEPYSISVGARALSDGGKVAFTLSETDPVSGEGRTRVITAKGQRWDTIDETRTSDPNPLYFFAPAINNGGTVVYLAGDGSGGSNLYLNRHGSLLSVLEIEPGQSSIQSFDLNNNGAVAYSRFGVDPIDSGVFLWERGRTVRVFNPSTQAASGDLPLSLYFYFFSQVSINDRQSVAFWLPGDECFVRSDGSQGCGVGVNRVVRVDDGVATTIARNTDDYSVKLNFDATPLNNRGEVLFSARSGPALQVPSSLYVRDRQTTCRVLGAGDTLFDKRIDDLGPAAINDRGEVLLWTYSADDDRIAVVVGTPRGRKCTTR